jgi:NodT family efflux transporter outer membrane factor (OMF) lipoprotein
MIPLVCALTMTIGGCAMVGPDYIAPEAPVSDGWIEKDREQVSADPAVDLSRWWDVFEDPVLDRLIEMAYAQNLPLQVAGVRVLEAQARRGLSISGLFPQMQQVAGGYARSKISRHAANQGNSALDRSFDNWQTGFDAAWEVDLWGKFRRGIEAADAELIGSVANYDDVLVSLIGEIASTYIGIRSFEEQLRVARHNVKIQSRSYEITDVKYRNGTVTELDAVQARSQLRETESKIPRLEAGVRQNQNTLCVLLGIPPRDLEDILGAGESGIPVAPGEIAVGIPAELLRRRPDVQRAEREVAAQSAQIGIALTDLYPSFQLIGSIGFQAEDIGDLFTGKSFTAFGGPTVRWNILNYGQIRNNVRVQDARYQQLLIRYEDVVLRAQQEVEDAIAGFLGAKAELVSLRSAEAAAERSVEIANIQYREGEVEYNTVFNVQQLLLRQQGSRVVIEASTALNLVALYKALGGGWELRAGDDFVPEETKKVMRERTNWGSLLDEEQPQKDVEQAATGTESERGWWRWRWWWPRW